MADVGRPTELTDELTLQIRRLVLDDKSYTDIQQILDISPGTWDSWVYRDQDGFRGKLVTWRHERMVNKAEVKVDVLMDSDDDRVALNASTFTLETLGKDGGYSKRSELTGKDGKDLPTPILNVFPDNSDQENSETGQED